MNMIDNYIDYAIKNLICYCNMASCFYINNLKVSISIPVDNKQINSLLFLNVIHLSIINVLNSMWLYLFIMLIVYLLIFLLSLRNIYKAR